LAVLDLSYNGIEAAGGGDLLKALPHCVGLVDLKLKANRILDDDILAPIFLPLTQTLTRLHTLDISENDVDSEVARMTIAQASYPPSLPPSIPPFLSLQSPLPLAGGVLS
ncbi:hypothetical protein T484DRAFT_1820305, partial [Baffinella frigidus]